MSAAETASRSNTRLSLLKRGRPMLEALEPRLLYCGIEAAHQYDNMDPAVASGLDHSAAPGRMISSGPVSRSIRAPAGSAPVSRWTGVVRPRSSKLYTFRVPGTDAVRLWVDGKKVIDRGMGSPSGRAAGSIRLRAGQAYDVRMEYLPRTARSSTRQPERPRILWGAAGSSHQEAVPQSQLATYDIRFAIIGDFGCNCTGERDVANLVKSWGVDFIVTTGDNSYPDASAAHLDKNVGQYYHEFIHPYRGAYGAGSPTGANRFFPIMGNHDWDGGSSTNYLNYFSLPGNERYYEMRAGPVHIFAVDSDSREPDGISSTSVQAQWLRDRMSASTAAWQIPLVHHPPYSSTGATSTTMRWPYKTWGADALVAGHAHVYERIEMGGLTYFVNGLGGAAKHSFTTPVEGSQVRYAADVGAMLVHADRQAITFQFINRAGSVIDTRTLNAPPPPPMDAIVVRPSDDGSGGGWRPVSGSPLPREVGRAGVADADVVNRGGGEEADGRLASRPLPVARHTPAVRSAGEPPRRRFDLQPHVSRGGAHVPVVKARPPAPLRLDPSFEINSPTMMRIA
jgi:hypothetical protein